MGDRRLRRQRGEEAVGLALGHLQPRFQAVGQRLRLIKDRVGTGAEDGHPRRGGKPLRHRIIARIAPDDPVRIQPALIGGKRTWPQPPGLILPQPLPAADEALFLDYIGSGPLTRPETRLRLAESVALMLASPAFQWM